VRELRIKKAVKRLEIAIRRAFIASLQLRSHFRSGMKIPPLPLDLSSTPTILFLRQDKLGDAIISTPVFIELYKKYPNGHFIMLLGEKNQGIADLLPIPCEIIVYRKKPLADIAMLRKLRKRKIDVLIDLMDNPSSTSSILTAAISAKYSIGINKENASSYNITVPLVDRSKYHIARRIAELLRPFGIDPDTIELRARLHNVSGEKVIGRLGLIISAGVPERQLLPEINSEIAKGVLQNPNINQVMLFFHPKDRKEAESIQRETGNSQVVLAPLTHTFHEYASLLKTCEYVITPDTSAVHLCSAFNIPAVVIASPFPPTLHYWTPIGVPYEMITQEIRTLNYATVLDHLQLLIQKVALNIPEAMTAA